MAVIMGIGLLFYILLGVYVVTIYGLITLLMIHVNGLVGVTLIMSR